MGSSPSNAHQEQPCQRTYNDNNITCNCPEILRGGESLIGARLKRAMDLSISLVAIVLFSPIFLLIIVAIKLESPGPVFFRQQRTGMDGRVFLIVKFRTMYHAPEEARQARKHDPRTTRVGRFLRSTSLDEFPQLLNVLRGEMSLVGPRPHPLWLDAEYARLISRYERRNSVIPGITGLAQINNCRGEIPCTEEMSRRISWDIHYIDHWSIALDIKILLKTLVVFWRDKKSY